MTLTKEQAVEIKKQLLAQVEQLPQENKDQIKEHIEKLDEKQLEEFLKQNKIQIGQSPGGAGGEGGAEGAEPSTQCIFCSIINKEVPSYKIAENKKAIAILDINPLSKGHSMVLPIEHITTEKLPKSALTLSQKIAKKIKLKLKPEDIKIETSSFQGHTMVNIIPIYKDEKMEKKKASESELKKLQSMLETKKRSPRTSAPKKKSIKISDLPEVGFRIP